MNSFSEYLLLIYACSVCSLGIFITNLKIEIVQLEEAFYSLPPLH